MVSVKTRISSNKKPLLIVGLCIILALVTLFVLEKTHIINLYTKNESASEPNDSEAKTTSTAPTAQENFSSGGDRPITRGEKDEGLLEDTGGNIPTVPSQDQWSTSSDGLITAYSPAKNSMLISGSSVSGASNHAKVSFRLIDDVSGVIAQGTLSVANGKFSGSFKFTTIGTNGRLDLFTATADGVESSNIEIPVRFK